MCQQVGVHHLLLQKLPYAHAYCKVILDGEGKPIDFTILDVNEAFTKMVGLSREDIVLRKASEVFPALVNSSFNWFAVFGRVALEEGEATFEQYFGPIARWVEVSAYNIEPGCFAAVFRDITRQKSEQTSLKLEKEDLTRLLSFQSQMLDTAAVWIETRDRDGNVILWNKAAERISGYSVEEVIGHKKIWEWIYPDPTYRAELLGKLKQVVEEGGKIENFETRILRKDGEFRVISWHSNALKANGAIVGCISLGVDITEQKMAEEGLRESEQKFRAIAESSPIAVMIYQDNCFVYVNPAAESISGYSSQELYRMCFWEIVHPDYRQLVRERGLRRQAGQEAPNPYDFKIVTKNGEERWVSLTGTSIQYNGAPAGFITVIDINERKQMEKALRESEERYRLLVENANEAILVVQDEAIKFANPKTAELTGYSNEEILSLHFTTFIYSRDQEMILNLYRQSLRGELWDRRYRFRVLKKGGKTRWVETSTVRIEWEGRPASLNLIFDITEQKQALEKLTEAYRRLDEIIEFLPDATFVIDSQGMVIAWNRAMEEITGILKRQMIGKNNYEYAVALYGERRPMLVDLALTKDEGHAIWEKEYEYIYGSGDTIYAEAFAPKLCGGRGAFLWGSASRLCDSSGKVIGAIESIRDITERKLTEEKIRYLSFHDSLTGLYNRLFLEEEMKRLNTERQHPISVIMADLNGLKLVNDAYGHSVGDKMLLGAAEILRSSCRKEDIIARWGGDEFVILLPQTKESEAQEICRRINRECRNTRVENVPFSMSLGAASKARAETSLAEVLRQAEDSMYKQKLAESRSVRSSVLYALLKALGEKSYETEEHALRMKHLALKIGEKIELSEAELGRLSLLVSLHDLGKITISQETLMKEGELTEKEWEAIKEHPETGYRIARSTEEFAHVAEDILAHHERWDGKGYPQQLKGEEIPLLARITAIVDTYDVITNGRSYKKALSHREALAEIKRCAGTQFDPQLVEVFLEVMEKGEG